MVFAPRPRIESFTIAPGHAAYVIDDALTEPHRWIDLAAKHHTDFARSPHNAFPGPELRLPDALSARLGEYFSQHIRSRLGARRIERCYGRLSLAMLQPQQLEPRQWIAHRDVLEPEPGKLTAACVLYLFEDPELGGTVFFAPKRPLQETRVLVHESGRLDPAAFNAKYGFTPGYMTAGNAWFEKTASIAPRFNRVVFYDGGAVFHCSDIRVPEKLRDDPRSGRLTLNGFFVCRANLAA